MPLTPEDVRNRRFKNAFRGYDETEVDTFLDEVEVELTRLLGEQDELRKKLQAAQAAPPPQTVQSEAEDMLRRTLVLAQRTADETVASAQAEAERMTSEAQTQAATLMQQAQEQAAAAIGDLERRKQALEQHIEGLRAFEREYRTRLKAYLESQLRDLEGRSQPPAEGAPQPAAGQPGGQSGGVPAAMPPEPGPAAVPAPQQVPPAMHTVADKPSPFDLDGGSEVPRLAP